MIEIQNVSFSYGKKKVLSNISAQFNAGELSFIIGANGSGKSTLLSLLARLLVPKRGTLDIDERSYTSFSSKDFAKKVSVMIQQRKIPDVSVYEFVSYGRYPYPGFSRGLSKEDEKAVENALKKTNTKQFSQRSIASLSGGERQRVYIAMLLAQDTPYILLDEPTTFLDLSYSIEIAELLKELKNEGKGIICVMHDIASALKYGDRILLLKEGRVLLDSTPGVVSDSKELEEALNVRCEKAVIDGETHYFFRKI